MLLHVAHPEAHGPVPLCGRSGFAPSELVAEPVFYSVTGVDRCWECGSIIGVDTTTTDQADDPAYWRDLAEGFRRVAADGLAALLESTVSVNDLCDQVSGLVDRVTTLEQAVRSHRAGVRFLRHLADEPADLALWSIVDHQVAPPTTKEHP